MQRRRSGRPNGLALALGLSAITLFAASCSRVPTQQPAPNVAPTVDVSIDGVSFAAPASRWHIAAAGWDACGMRAEFERRASRQARGIVHYELMDPERSDAGVQEWYGIDRAPYLHGVTLRRLPGCHTGDRLTVWLASTLPLTADQEAPDQFAAMAGEQVVGHYRGLQVFDAEGNDVAFTLQQAGVTELALALDLTGAVFPLTIDPWIELAGLGAVSLPGPNGEAVASSDDGHWLAVEEQSDRGAAVQLYVRDRDGTWIRSQRIPAPRSVRHLQFGARLAFAGESLAVAALPKRPNSADSTVLTYRPGRDGRWQLQQTLEAADARAGRSHGAVLAGDPDWLAVAAPPREWQAEAIVDLYIAGPNGLVPRARLAGPQPNQPDGFSRALSVSDGQLFVGAPLTHAGAPHAGRVFVYRLDGDGPELLGPIDPPTPQLRGQFGTHLASNSRWLVVGGAGERLFVYAREAGEWAWVGEVAVDGGSIDALDLRGDHLIVRSDARSSAVSVVDLTTLQQVHTEAVQTDGAIRSPMASALVTPRVAASIASAGSDDTKGKPTKPVELTLLVPAEGVVLPERRPELTFEYRASTAIDTASLRWTIADQSVALNCDRQRPAQPLAGRLQCRPDHDLSEGPQTWQFTIKTRRGDVSPAVLRTVTIGDVATTPPPPIAESAVRLTAITDGWRIDVDAAAIAAGAEMVARRQGLTDWIVGRPDGAGWTVEVPAAPGDDLLIAARNSAGTSEPLRLTPGLPEPPTETAPPLDDGGASTSGPAADFLIAGPDPVQRDADPAAFEAERSAVVRGKLIDRDGEPLAGVHVSVNGHDEYGYTLSRENGEYDLLVNGGGVLVLQFRKSGYLFAQRQVEAPWRDFVVVADVALVALDPAVTVIEAGSSEPQLAVGSVSDDDSGARQPAVYFPPGTQASLVMADGSLQPMAELDVRMTEYTVGANGVAAMPSPLPPTTAYTYAVELSVDQALQQGTKIDGRDVVFDRPVAFYVDNFMAFPVGEGVPTGYYDNTAAEWKAIDDGRVIGVLEIVDGRAVLDVDGSGIAANTNALAALGINDDERSMIARRFGAGQTFWRVQMTHFSTWDCNWPFGLPLDMIEHFVEMLIDALKSENEADECGCEIGTTTLDVGEQTDVPGLPGNLRYDSSRLFRPGNTGPAVTLTLTPGRIPPSMKRVVLELDFLGRKGTYRYAPVPSLKARIPLVMLDPYYREREGTYPLKIRVGYVYRPLIYGAGGRSSGGGRARSFGAAGMFPVTGDRERMEITDWWEDTESVTFQSAKTQRETGGWQVSFQHVLDVASGTLMMGDGRTVAQNQRPETLRTIAGSSGVGNAVEGAPATGLALDTPHGVAVDARGRVFIADTGNHRVRRLDSDGRLYTVAGTGSPGYGGDGGPATTAALHSPTALAFDEEGRLYVADSGNHRIRRINIDGSIVTIAGTGAPGLANDGDAASTALLDSPQGIATNRFGYVFIADTGNDRVWSIQPDGTLLRLAGGGNGDGSRALDVPLAAPTQLAADSFGNVYVAEAGAGRVRLVRPDGLIFTAAGGGSEPAADNIPATSARIAPAGLAIDYAQRLLIADEGHHRIRRVDGNGVITTIAGSGAVGYGADSLSARRVPIEAPRAVAVDRSGRVLFAHYHAIRRIGHERNAASGGELTVADPSGETLHVFDGQGRHLRTLDALTGGLLYRLEYQSGVMVRMVDAFGNATTIERDASGQPTGIRSPDGQLTQIELDTRGYLAATVSPEGHATRFGYTTDGRMLWMRNAREQQWNYVYDADGRLAQDNRPDGSGWTITSTDLGSGRETEFTSRLGRVTTYGVVNRPDGTEVRYTRAADGSETYREISPSGDAIALHADGSSTRTEKAPHPRFGTQVMLPTRSVIETPSGLRSEIQHHYAAEPAGVRDPADLQRWTETTTVNGRDFVLEFDRPSMTFESRTPMGRTAAMQVDAQRRPLKLQVPGLADLDYQYDARGRLEAVRQSDGIETREYRFGYDANGSLNSVTDPLTRTVSITNDRDGRPTLLTLPDNREIDLDVDGTGNVTALQTPEGHIHRFGYDPVDRENRYEAPLIDGGPTVTSTTYDSDGNPQRQELPGGIALSFSYDAFGRLNNVSRPSQLGDYGNEVRLDYEYDGFLTTAEKSSGAVNGEVRYGYDNEFRLTELQAPGATTHYEFDDDGLLVKATTEDTTGASNTPVELTLERDPDNGLLLGTQAGIVSDSWEWNAFGEPRRYEAKAGANTLFVQEFERDKLGRITRKTETVLGVTTVYEYRYDVAGRLEEVKINGVVDESYTYDRNGNRKTLTKNGVTTVYEYDAQDRLLSQGDCTYTYTAHGELQTQTCGGQLTRYSYSVFGDLTAATMPNGALIEYVLDGNGRRIATRINGEIVQQLAYADQLRPLKVQSTAVGEVSFAYADKPHVPSIANWSGRTYRLISDYIGTVRILVDVHSGTVVGRYNYDTWGNQLGSEGDDIDPFGFAGGLASDESRLVRFGARDYEPSLGRWLTRDPIGFSGRQSSLYSYVSQDPVNYFDPAGTIAWGVAFAAVDLGFQLYMNGGDIGAVNWAEVGMSAVGGGLLNALAKGAFRLKTVGSHTWNATRSWMNRRNIQMINPGQQRHHWALEQNQGFGKYFPNWLKNQPWNTNPISARFNNWLGRHPWLAWLGAPTWAAEILGGSALWIGGENDCEQ